MTISESSSNENEDVNDVSCEDNPQSEHLSNIPQDSYNHTITVSPTIVRSAARQLHHLMLPSRGWASSSTMWELEQTWVTLSLLSLLRAMLYKWQNNEQQSIRFHTWTIFIKKSMWFAKIVKFIMKKTLKLYRECLKENDCWKQITWFASTGPHLRIW